jgi:hypothetical protein
MKILVSLLAFVATLALTSTSLAEDHEKIAEKMNALFPHKEAQLEKRKVPAKPELSSPAYYSVVNGGGANLEWKAVQGADEYHVQVATDANFKWLVSEEHHNKGTSFQVSGLQAGQHYFWRVAAVKSENWSTFRKSFFAMSMFKTAGQ